MRYLLTDPQGLAVAGPYTWDGLTPWRPSEGTPVAAPGPESVGWTWDGRTWSPPVVDLEVVRTEALDEVVALATSRQASGVAIDGVGVLGVHPDAERSWASLHGRVAVALRRGEDPNKVVFPVVFPGADGSYITLPTLEEADAVYAELYRVGAERQAQGEAAAYLVRQAATVEEIGVVLDGYRGGGVPGRPLPPS